MEDLINRLKLLELDLQKLDSLPLDKEAVHTILYEILNDKHEKFLKKQWNWILPFPLGKPRVIG